MADDEIPAALSRENSTVMVTERNIMIKPPVFSSSAFESYREEVTIWRELCGLPNNKQAIFLWYQLPRDDPSDIKAKIMNEVGLDSSFFRLEFTRGATLCLNIQSTVV